ncbi:MAG: RDD family protein [Bacteroidia bacterium]
MANLSVKTNFNTKLNLEVDTIGKRVLAYFIDLAVLGLYLVFLVYLLSFFDFDLIESFGDDSSRVIWGWQSILMLPFMFYTLFSEVISGGYTIGKYLAKIKVVKVNGFQPTFVEFFIRWIFRTVDIYALIIISISFGGTVSNILSGYSVGLVGLITMARNKRGQRIGDIVAGTAVVKTKVQHSMNITIMKELKSDYQPTYPQVIKLSDNDARIIKDTYEGAKKMKDEKLIRKLVNKLEVVMKIKCDTTNRQFIETVLKDFNYYTQDM